LAEQEALLFAFNIDAVHSFWSATEGEKIRDVIKNPAMQEPERGLKYPND
jgi:hypothetical protein